MKKVSLFLTMFLFTVLTQSCTIDENGDFHLTWLFWFLITGFILLVIFASISTNNEQKNTDAKLKAKGLKSTDFKRTDATYVGGHPDVDNNVPYLVYRISERKLMFYSRLADYQMPSFAFEIPVDAIKSIEIEDASSIERKVTIGRMFLVGIFAFAWKKKKKHELAFVTFDWNDGKFDHTTILNIEGKDAMQKANKLRNQFIRDIGSSI